MIETYLEWTGSPNETATLFGQTIQMRTGLEPNDPLGTLYINIEGFVGTPLTMPNSTASSPAWTPIPGSVPTIEARQDGSYPMNLIRVRTATTLIKEADTIAYNRPTLVSPGTAPDSFVLQYNGVRVVYGNEYNCLRVRGIPDTQVPARFMSNAARDNTTLPTFQVGLSDATTYHFQILANGSVLGPNNLSMLPSTPLAVVFTGNMGNAALINDGVGANTGAPYPVTTTLHASANRVYLDGNIANNGGVAIPAQTTLFTIDAAHRPTAWCQFSVRTSTNLAVRFTVKGATGIVVADQSMAAGATLNLDGLNYRKA